MSKTVTACIHEKPLMNNSLQEKRRHTMGKTTVVLNLPDDVVENFRYVNTLPDQSGSFSGHARHYNTHVMS